MIPWWVVAVLGAVVALAGVLLLGWRCRSLRGGASYIAVPAAQEPIDPLLRSQLNASLSESPSTRTDPIQNLRNWATGTSDLVAEFDDFRRQVRTLQTYVLELDSRYMRRDEAAWLSLQVAALILGVATGVSTAVWALIELTQ
jgi:hypothetical protein